MTLWPDQWGDLVTCATPDTLMAWDRAWNEALYFCDDPFATLHDVNEADDEFVLGSVFCATYRVLGGTPLDDPLLAQDLSRAAHRASSERDVAHVAAVQELAAGNYRQAGLRWAALVEEGRDFAAARFAHDTCLHTADVDLMLRSAQHAMDHWGNDHGWNFLAGQLSFALEEAGHYDTAGDVGALALHADPEDVWARHAVVHVCESTDDHELAMALLRDDQTWAEQDGLAVHLWWHLGLRLFAAGDLDAVLALHDEIRPQATTAFRLCDLASLLWRLELADVDVGDRWDLLAEDFAGRPQLQASAFVAVHGAMAFTRCGGHPAAGAFFDQIGDREARRGERGDGEAASIFANVVEPLVASVRASADNRSGFVDVYDALAPTIHLIGGSVAQRDVLSMSRTAFAENKSSDQGAGQ